jgi:hypothetical protein
MRKRMLAIGMAVALATATLAGGAMAAPMHGGLGGMGRAGTAGPGPGIGRPGGVGPGLGFNRPVGPGPGFVRPGVGTGRFAFRGRRFFGPGIGLYAYGGWPWWGTGGCWVHRWVWTPFGWRWRLVDVC